MATSLKTEFIAWSCGVLLLGAMGWWAQGHVEGKRRNGEFRLQQRRAQIDALRQTNERLRSEAVQRETASATNVSPEAPTDAGAVSSGAVRVAALRYLGDLKSSNLLRTDGRAEASERVRRMREAGPAGMANAAATLTPPGSAEVYRLTPEGRLPEQFAGLFQLDAARFAALQEVVAASKRQVDEVLVAATTVARPMPDQLAMEVRAMAAAGPVRERLRTAMIEVLGPDRFEAYDHLQKEGFATLWSAFGIDDRDIAITAMPGGPGKYKVEIQTLDEQGRRRGGSGSNGLALPALQARLGPLAKLLPPDL